jgi:hypothetical protein
MSRLIRASFDTFLAITVGGIARQLTTAAILSATNQPFSGGAIIPPQGTRLFFPDHIRSVGVAAEDGTELSHLLYDPRGAVMRKTSS